MDAGSIADWVSGLGSFGAVVVAVHLARDGYRRSEEARKADRLEREAEREAELQERMEQRKAIIRDACSASDKVVAYHASLAGLLRNMGSPLSLHALVRINEQIVSQSEILSILAHRPELTDGAMTAVVTANRAAKRIIDALSVLEHATREDWHRAASKLQTLDAAVKIAAQSSSSVRAHFQLDPSTAASSILSKYDQLIRELENPTGDQGVPTFPGLEELRY